MQFIISATGDSGNTMLLRKKRRDSTPEATMLTAELLSPSSTEVQATCEPGSLKPCLEETIVNAGGHE